MNKKQVLSLLAVICIISVVTGILSLFTDDAAWIGAGIGLGIAYVGGGLVLLYGVVKLVRMLTDSKTTPEQRKWTQKRLLFIAVAAAIIFVATYLGTPRS